jgi:putative membrane protein
VDYDAMYQMMGGDMMGGSMTAFAWFWAAFAVALLLLAVVGGIALFRAVTRQATTPTPPGTPPADPARAELDLRYARGEVDREEYLQRRADLEADRS